MANKFSMQCKLREPHANLKHGYLSHMTPFPIPVKSRTSMVGLIWLVLVITMLHM